MKFIDEKGRLFGKINIFDFILLIALVLVIGAVSYKVIQDRREKSGQIATKTYILTVKAEAMPDSFAEALQKDNRIYYDNDGFVNAKIINVREEPAVLKGLTDDGRIVKAESADLKDVYIDIEVADKLSDPDIKVGRYSVAVGGKFAVKTIYAMASESTVIDIKEK
jgi:hypothetical protein